jgi:hypothetical protein
VPDEDLVQRLTHWATSMPGMPDAILRLVAGGYLDDTVFLAACIHDMDGADVAIVDWTSARALLASHYSPDAGKCLQDALQKAHGSLGETDRWTMAFETNRRLDHDYP